MWKLLHSLLFCLLINNILGSSTSGGRLILQEGAKRQMQEINAAEDAFSILFISDMETEYRGHTKDMCWNVVRWITNIAHEGLTFNDEYDTIPIKPDLVIHGGDVSDTTHGTWAKQSDHASDYLYYHVWQQLYEAGIPMISGLGNHDYGAGLTDQIKKEANKFVLQSYEKSEQVLGDNNFNFNEFRSTKSKHAPSLFKSEFNGLQIVNLNYYALYDDDSAYENRIQFDSLAQSLDDKKKTIFFGHIPLSVLEGGLKQHEPFEIKLGDRYLCLTTAMIMSECTGNNDQRWLYRPATCAIMNIENGKCLDISEEKVSVNGAEVILYQCTGQKNQQWHFNKYGEGDDKVPIIKNVADCLDHNADANSGGKCLDISYSNTNIIIWECDGKDNQQFDSDFDIPYPYSIFRTTKDLISKFDKTIYLSGHKHWKSNKPYGNFEEYVAAYPHFQGKGDGSFFDPGMYAILVSPTSGILQVKNVEIPYYEISGCMQDGTICTEADSIGTCGWCCRGSSYWWSKAFFACGYEEEWEDGTPCGLGTTCDACKNEASYWWGRVFTACGTEPCWAETTTCGIGTTCNACCSGNNNAYCPWYWFGVCTCGGFNHVLSQFMSVEHGQCIGVGVNEETNSLELNMYDCLGENAKTWDMDLDSGLIKNNDLCIEGGSSVAHVALCNAAKENQIWTLKSSGAYRKIMNGENCLQVYGYIALGVQKYMLTVGKCGSYAEWSMHNVIHDVFIA